jgi:outer membrane biosynthesis protein TonB
MANTPSRSGKRSWRLLPFLLAAAALHAVGLLVTAPLFPLLLRGAPSRPDIIELVEFEPAFRTPRERAAEEDEPEEEPEEEEPFEPSGQIVEVAPPENPEIPEEADYLAAYNQKVDEETRSEKFKVNPDVLARKFSTQERVELRGENVPDLRMTAPANGATVGEERFDPTRNGLISALPSRWSQTNKEGADNPVPSAALESVLAGAPQNDLLDEKRGAETSLNTREFLYASYLLRIRQLVNFYWNQNLQNLPPSVRLAKPSYKTTVEAVLDGNGLLESLKISEGSGSGELDDCVVRAFKVAGPYPNPPDGLIAKDGWVHLPQMGFTVTLGVAQMRYEGVDPRAGVEFPGILKAPR